MGMLTMHDFVDGNWAMVVTFPKDFDPVATTELGMIAKLRSAVCLSVCLFV